MSIYKPCDIRGDATAELSADLYRRWGRLLGLRLPPGAKFLAGGDVRESTPPFLAALVDGLCEAGLDVIDLGLMPTPMIYYAKHRVRADGCAIVTASHNPASVNGLKWMVGDNPPTPDEVAAMAADIKPRPVVAPRTATTGRGFVSDAPTTPAAQSRVPTTPRTLDVSFDYVASLQETFVDSLAAERHIVIDPMHGGWSAKARRYLHAIFPRCLFSTIHDAADGQFGGRTPDCSRADSLAELCEAVYCERAHLGVAFDGDGDRVAFVDNEGVALSAEEATWALLHAVGDDLRGRPFVYDLKFSDRIPEAARQLGAEPLVERSGHAFLRARMQASGAVFGAEQSGHYFYRALAGGDDGLYTACRLIAFLARSDRPLSALRRECPPVYITPDLRIPAPPQAQSRLIEQVRAAWAGFPQTTIDGVRIDTPGGWALMRASVTEPALTFRFEGLDWHALDDLVRRFCAALPELGDELHRRYAAAMGMEGP